METSPINVENNAQGLYSGAIQHVAFPKKEEAVIVDSIDGISPIEYAYAIGKLIGAKNVSSASKISNGRIYLQTTGEQFVEQLTHKDTAIRIGTQKLSIRPYITKAKKIVLAHVFPYIPNYLIERKLEEFGVKLTTKITVIKFGHTAPEYFHLESHRRQFLIHAEDVCKIPMIFTNLLDSTKYWVYPSPDNFSCFNCQESGHVAKNCKKPNRQNPIKTAKTIVSPSNAQHESNNNRVTVETASDIHRVNKEKKSDELLSPGVPPIDNVVNSAHSNFVTPYNTRSQQSKRSHSQDSSVVVQRVKRRMKGDVGGQALDDGGPTVLGRDTSTALSGSERVIREQTIPVREAMESDPSRYPITYDQLAAFLMRTHGSTNVSSIAFSVTTDQSALIAMLREVAPLILVKSLRHRVVRITKKLDSNNPKSSATPHEEELSLMTNSCSSPPDSRESEDVWSPVQALFSDNSSEFPIDYLQVQQLLSSPRVYSVTTSEVLQLSDDTERLVHMFNRVKNLLPPGKMRNGAALLAMKLKDIIEPPSEEEIEDSDPES